MKFVFRILCLLSLLAGVTAPQSGQAQSSDNPIYVPFIATGEDTKSIPAPAGGVQVNVPFFTDTIDQHAEFSQMAVFWFGSVRGDTNYTDIRAGYSTGELVLIAEVFDRRLWYNPSEDGSTLQNWDAVTISLDLNGATTAQQPNNQSYRFVVQVRHWQAAANYQAAYRGNGSGWNRQSIPFSASIATSAGPAPNDARDDRGWRATVRIPFSSLGLGGAPGDSTQWKLAVQLHDRDDPAAQPLPVQMWPVGSSANAPAAWGNLRFGVPGYTPPAVTGLQTTTVREGVNGAVVPDAMVGGGTLCGGNLDYWTQWGDKNYDGIFENNVQNQIDVSDWPCFSRYYLSFPLSAIPAGKVIRSATLVMNHFGGSGQNDSQTPPTSSFIQVIAVYGNWNESMVTWNNGPAFRENIATTRVPVIPAGGAPANRQWDVSRAVTQAYQQGQPLNIALYSADSSMHSGKYFRGSEFRDAPYRPTLIIEWGNR